MVHKNFIIKDSISELYNSSEPATGEIYKHGIYKYVFNGCFDINGDVDIFEGQNGWGVQLEDRASTSPVTESPLNEILGYSVINLNYMFYNSNAESINLTAEIPENPVCNNVFANNFGRNAISMMAMFKCSKSNTITLPVGFGVEAKNMQMMFRKSRATTIILPEGFGVKATNLKGMFSKSDVITLDLPTWFGAETLEIFDIFQDLKATAGYTKTQEEANKWNYSNGITKKPKGLFFTVKP